MAKREAPEVNAGSMADIAFLLLIFFLVTTTIGVDQGINRLLPRYEENPPAPPINERNIMRVLVNKDNQLLVNEQLMNIKQLRQAAIDFLDNNGEGNCSYCKGKGNPQSSDDPDEAVISLMNDGQTTYETYIAVQNELVAAYYFLRDREAMKRYGKTYREMEYVYNDPASKAVEGLVDDLKPKVEKIQNMYPMRLSEAEPKKNY
ncbi:biopolymer transporter ExbD [Flavobacterium sp. NRK F10]|uniref:Biopolymer transporter ExbD n=1 Tax=Flavobacterium sediminis TaxID=2201181 RepID=A0A2U8QVA3_9FLAO|nr:MULTISPECIES: biopolymer transporter ExbD [Flavobacterium]AWM13804.1 biopolymer transporter ExbD [Flavobacterium sediminis]MCO6174964.1 biopolymer transporter ExbD [Flavobacterium sp. NRK F10]